MSDSKKYVTAGVECPKCHGAMFVGYWDISNDLRIDSGATTVAMPTAGGGSADAASRAPNSSFVTLRGSMMGYQDHAPALVNLTRISRSSLSPLAPTGRRSIPFLKCIQCGTQQETRR